MKKIELLLILLVLAGVILKLTHSPGADIVLIVFIGILAQFYFAVGFAIFNDIRLRDIFSKRAYHNTNSLTIILGILTGLNLSIGTLGILFKIMGYPGANLMLYVGLISLGLILTFVLIHRILKGSHKFSTTLTRIVPFQLIGIFLLTIPSITLLNWQYPNNPEYVEAVIELRKNPNDLNLQQKEKEERKKMYRELFKEP